MTFGHGIVVAKINATGSGTKHPVVSVAVGIDNGPAVQGTLKAPGGHVAALAGRARNGERRNVGVTGQADLETSWSRDSDVVREIHTNETEFVGFGGALVLNISEILDFARREGERLGAAGKGHGKVDAVDVRNPCSSGVTQAGITHGAGIAGGATDIQCPVGSAVTVEFRIAAVGAGS